MENSLFCLPQWKSLSHSERLAAAHDLVKHLPDGFAFQGMELGSPGTESHAIAFFNWKPDDTVSGKFALIPGGEVTLGYDRSQPFVPTPAQADSWRGTQEEYETPDLADFLEPYLTPRRTVTFPPFLMETKLQEPESLDETLAENKKHGFRLPTSDEWEWACGAGAQTFWRWGNDCPTDAYPSDLRKETAKWDIHRRPNAFGLHIADDDYHLELCEDTIIRGGNGGTFTCGGVGYLAAWLTLATAYFSPGEEASENGEYCQVRRVLPL